MTKHPITGSIQTGNPKRISGISADTFGCVTRKYIMPFRFIIKNSSETVEKTR